MALTLPVVARHVVDRYPDACVVSTCGYPSRDLYAALDRPENLYLLGSMGMAAPIAIGIALARPGRRVVAIDGDGSLLMNLGVLPVVATAGVDVLHVVVDNGMHESTGGQATAARADFVALALAAGYAAAARVETADELVDVDVDAAPTLLHVVTGPRAEIGRRVAHTPQQIVHRVNTALNRNRSDQPAVVPA